MEENLDAIRAGLRARIKYQCGRGSPPMSYERFRELWKDAGFTFECSPHLSVALVKAANGDYSDFDKIERFLENAK